MSTFKLHKNSTGEKLRAILDYAPTLRRVKTPPTTLGEIYKNWLAIKRLEVADGTIKNILSYYKANLESYADREMSSFTTSELQDMLTRFAKRYVSAKRPFGLLRSIFNHAERLGIITDNPINKLLVPKAKRKPPKDNFYDKSELELFLKLAKEQLQYQWYVFYYLLAHTGLRRGEALALKWIDLDKDSIFVRRTLSRSLEGHTISETAKTDAGYRRVYIESDVYNLLMTLFNTSEYIFTNTKGSYITSSQPIRQLKKIKGIRYISPHGFRHTHCSLLFSAGVDIPTVQKRLGHSDLKTTMQVYNHVYKSDELTALNKYKAFMNT